MHRIALGATLALIAASTTNAQPAVQWRIEDGGNGHWYQRTSVAMSWSALQSWCTSKGGHLATLTSAPEGIWVKNNLPVVGCFIGGFQDASAPDYAEPLGGWRWVTNEPFQIIPSFMASFDDCPGGSPGSCGCGTPGAQNVLFFSGCCGVIVDDVGDGIIQNCDSDARFGIIEWSADCNGDGIVDYGQCRDGTLADYNGNNVPDCCESESPCAPNLIVNGGFEFGASQTDCTWVIHATGGSFVPGWTVIAASIDRLRISDSCPPGTESWTSFEGEFTIDLDGDTNGGAISQTVATEPGSRYRLSFHLTGNCGAPGIKQMRVEIGSTQYPFEHACSGTNPQPWSEKSIEFTAAASVTDIVFKSVSTSGRNGAVIDLVKMIRLEPQQPTCQSADLLADRNVNGADLGILLAQWGPNTQYTISDINHDGVVDGTDLGLLLSFWGPCPY